MRPISMSQLNLFSKCPHAWNLKYNWKIETKESLALLKGTMIHYMLEKKSQLKETTFQDFLNSKDKFGGKIFDKIEEIKKEKKFDCTDFLQVIWESIEKKMGEILNKVKIWKYESEKHITGEIMGYPFQGYIDFFSKNEGHIVEIKTTSRKGKTDIELIKNKAFLQMALYKILLKTDIKEYSMILINTPQKLIRRTIKKKLEPMEKYLKRIEDRVEISAARMVTNQQAITQAQQWIEHWTEKLGQSTSEGYYPRSFGGCMTCFYQKDCFRYAEHEPIK